MGGGHAVNHSLSALATGVVIALGDAHLLAPEHSLARSVAVVLDSLAGGIEADAALDPTWVRAAETPPPTDRVEVRGRMERGIFCAHAWRPMRPRPVATAPAPADSATVLEDDPRAELGAREVVDVALVASLLRQRLFAAGFLTVVEAGEGEVEEVLLAVLAPVLEAR